MTCRDWISELRPATFRGVEFYVAQKNPSVGRRLDVHEFPMGEASYVEDMGAKTPRFRVTAYIANDEADSQARALRAACQRRGAGRLSLPWDSLRAHCESCSETFDHERLGYIGFDLAFVADSGLAGGLIPGVALLNSAFVAAQGLAEQVRGLFSGSFLTRGQPSYVRNAATAAIADVAAAIEVARGAIVFRDDNGARVERAVQALFDDAGALSVSGTIPDRFAQRAFAGVDDAPADSAFVERLDHVLTAMREASDENATFQTAIADLIAYRSADEVDAAGNQVGKLGMAGERRATRHRIADNAAAVSAAVRLVAIAHHVQAAMDTEFSDRRAAIQARADIAAMVTVEMRALAGDRDGAVYRGFTALKGQAAEALTREIIDLAPILDVEGRNTMPALWWAQRLFGTGRAAGDIASLNSVIHPSFMPLRFQARAPDGQQS